MASSLRLRKKVIYYRLLNEGEYVEPRDAFISKPAVLKKTYDVKRLIWRKPNEAGNVSILMISTVKEIFFL